MVVGWAMGIQPEMVEDAVAHHTEAAGRMLAPVNSNVTYVENGLSEREQEAFRAAVVSRDLASVQRLGDIAKGRIANLAYDQVRDFLSHDERKMVRLRKDGMHTVVTVNGTDTSWANAVTMGLISFK
jgi:hypothetical protein